MGSEGIIKRPAVEAWRLDLPLITTIRGLSEESRINHLTLLLTNLHLVKTINMFIFLVFGGGDLGKKMCK